MYKGTYLSYHRDVQHVTALVNKYMAIGPVAVWMDTLVP